MIAMLMAWYQAFIMDDAFISLTYARYFSEGHGLVWQEGSHEFGYTNFLFTLLVGALMKFGIEPITAAAVISVPSFIATVLLVYRMVLFITPAAQWQALAASLSVVVHFSMASFATGGLETAMHAALIAASYHAALRKNPYDLAALASLALLTRLDSAILLLPAFMYLLRSALWRERMVLIAVPLLTLGLFLYGCYAFYGYALPNTFYAKMQLPRSFYAEGFEYIFTFVKANAYVPLVMLAIALWRPAKPILCLLFGCISWLAYIVYIGGDFMEFRLFVPLLPLLYVACFARFTHWAMCIAMLAVNGVVAFFYAPRFEPTRLVGNIQVLDDAITNPRHNWAMVGQALGALFYTDRADDVKLALHTTGAIPYYSRLTTIDIYGLNTRWVAQNGMPAGYIAGHRKKAPFSYLQDQGVNLLIPSLPRYICEEKDKLHIPAHHHLPKLLIPLASDCKVVAYYVTPHPRVEMLIRNQTIEQLP